jgi:hypothetical protein
VISEAFILPFRSPKRNIIVAAFGRFPHSHLCSKLKLKLASALLARRFCATQNNAIAAVVMIANQVLRSIRFFTDQSQGAALVPAADSVAAWKFQTPGSAL